MSALPDHARRRFLLGTGALGATALLAGCVSNTPPTQANPAPVAAGGDNVAPGPPVTIGFSAPAADHGWMAAMTTNARAQAELLPDVTFRPTEGSADVNQQIAQVETLINEKVDVLVILPADGKALTAVGRKAMDAGIPVVNIDRVFDSPEAYRVWIGGDNYGMGVNAANHIAAELGRRGVTNPVIAEIAGTDSLPLTQERSAGFRAGLAKHGLSVSRRVAAEFTVETGERQATNLLQAASRLDAVWNHDDDQGIGVLAAVESAGRNEFFLVGGAGSRPMMERIKAGGSVVQATVLYSPSMCSSAISLARLLGQSRGMSDLAEHEIPRSITTYSAVVTRDNVDQYLDVGFAS
ncbi:monosaccharide ABC transporter substrate-binding protein (CUT2 family) [Saccharopolyspora erythraea NRRL 2338]|uniref:Secreted solute binding protein n=2 Tax=Saccharopolyspora erythraea TaxID=1836 RepID=A4FDZ2_SACEN|nr:substrate-binding domain-containing protein [Saccharopolyspora erythraea]EQD82460.1 sugar ABC transporter substrate-binding protein [Saccharopolyspora erythraea D]PFG95997.1 monosaccharide ABC transporter substrate-binding protein (CUT2 family) [Saccharopolyspora erythraea NRRL 2338]QRK92556.1 substrate-binding domain-containing protein [Saccharopolyspora erythraea]CAM02267.1 putative secreted solute binding protein [Saccharopolyspora erythraea NRRL 2338]